ncbi:hypothetical protein [Argonema antarcticum]|uniref:hypothetical protein n=1 Tax=Argonema antarcticum TaxID=2942763 RepID=UPI0020118FF2|nr:hypothetical protein [Argonema antarcticum]MCL1473848.1 hypothetical protein [Argonema antarcticum A004/B2]
MAKGFAAKLEEQLGYVLLLVPEAKAYAARFSMSGQGEEFIGITNILEQAQVWQTKKQAKKAIEKYADFLLEEAKDDQPVRISLRLLKRSSDGQLTDESVESIFLVSKELLE